jgi:hypothetical protein
MKRSLSSRAAGIRDYLDKQNDLSADPMTLYKYSLAAAQWTAVRLMIDEGTGTLADEHRFADLTNVLKALSEQVGLGRDLTDSRGFLVRDPARIVCGTWQEAAAEGW